MFVRDHWNLAGPNVWARFPVFEVWIDQGEYRDRGTDAVAGFVDRLLTWLPGLACHLASGGEVDGFVPQLRRGTTLAHALERVVLELQTVAGSPVNFGHTERFVSQPDLWQVVIQYEELEVVEACLEVGRRLCLAAATGEPFDFSAELKSLQKVVDANRYGRTTAAIEAAARRRGIPVEHLDPDDGRLMALGWGVRQRWFLASQTDRASDLGQSISQDKELTKSLLRLIGVPVPTGRAVKDEEDAWAAAQKLGGPVVVKPRDRDLSAGVRVNLTTRAQVTAAYRAARQKSDAVIVEQYASGIDHRLLVVDGKVVAACRLDPPMVDGDGVSTIAQLVEETNAEPDRGDGISTPKAKINVDQLALESLQVQGYTLESIPPAGARVRIHYDPPPFENGGAIVDVTDQVHAEVAARVVEAVGMLRLDVAGVDLVAEDIGQPLEQQRGMILEVNAGPALWLHMAPWCNRPQPVAEAIVASVMPEGDGRIPIIAVTGVNGKSTTTWLAAHIVQGSGRKVGMTCTDGMFIARRRIASHDCSGPHSARAALRNPAVEVAILETARGGILRRGLGFDFCDVAVVTNIGEGDHLGSHGVETRHDLARVKAVVVQAVAPRGFAVLNVADPLVAAMASQCCGQIVYFGRDCKHPLLLRHLAAGGRAALVRDGWIVLAEGNQADPLIPLDAIPITYQGRIDFQIENALAAAAATWLVGIPCEAIRAGLASFVGGAEQSPGRFNVFQLPHATVIVDYAHNACALRALVDTLAVFPHQRRSIVYGGSDRRREDVMRQGEILGASFDHVMLYKYQNSNDWCGGDLNTLLREGIASGSRTSKVVECSCETEAFETALDGLEPGDLLILGPESIEKALDLVKARLAG